MTQFEIFEDLGIIMNNEVPRNVQHKYFVFGLCCLLNESLMFTLSRMMSVSVFISSLLFSSAASSKQVQDHFTRSDSIECAGNSIAITTSCQKSDRYGVFCNKQEINFKDGKSKNEKIITINHSIEDGYQSFINKAVCVGGEKKRFIILENTNFGNCQICEWTDVFLPSGVYLGSQPGMYGTDSFRRKRVPKKLEIQVMSSALVRECQSNGNCIEIYRTPK